MTIFDTICIQAVATLAQAGLIHNQRLPNKTNTSIYEVYELKLVFFSGDNLSLNLEE